MIEKIKETILLLVDVVYALYSIISQLMKKGTVNLFRSVKKTPKV